MPRRYRHTAAGKILGAGIALALGAFAVVTVSDDTDDPPARARITAPAAATREAELVRAGDGPLSAADRDLLVKVRLAGLWEIPVGRQAAERAARSKTRQNLGEIARMHVDLDADVRRVAAKLRVP
ncbi:hypothetical protein ACFFOQ_31705, partial [Planobispora takensis]